MMFLKKEVTRETVNTEGGDLELKYASQGEG